MVLQRAPSQAAVYGFLPNGTATAAVNVSMYDSATGQLVASSIAAVNATSQPFGDGWGARPCPKAVCPPYDMQPFTAWPEPLPSWKALLPPMPPGGDYFIVATCTSGCAGNGNFTISITNVTFGDVWFASGQSNMWLPVLHTFARNESAGNATAGLLNIRVMAGSSGSVPWSSWPPKYGNVGGSNPWMTAQQAAPQGCIEQQNCPLFNVGGTSWYFVQGLAQRGVNVPIGVLNTAIGGQRIEEFMVNATINICSGRSGENIPWWDGQLYGQQTLPFVDMTVKG
jgi:hypothetical protein